MKTPIFWTLRNSFGDYDLLAVTSETGPRLHGRDEHGVAAHVLAAQTRGRFLNEEEARDKVCAVRAIHKRRIDERIVHEEAIARIEAEADLEIKAILQAVPA